jgi:hypothetical protein
MLIACVEELKTNEQPADDFTHLFYNRVSGSFSLPLPTPSDMRCYGNVTSRVRQEHLPKCARIKEPLMEGQIPKVVDGPSMYKVFFTVSESLTMTRMILYGLLSCLTIAGCGFFSQNMTVQHTDPRRMHVEDIHRLKEAQAFIEDTNANYQNERLTIYLVEFASLLKHEDYKGQLAQGARNIKALRM